MTDLAQERQQAHAYLDQLPPAQLSAVRNLLASIVDPVSRALADAPLDDEEETEEERAAVDQARRSLEANGGRGIPHSEAMRRLGLE